VDSLIYLPSADLDSATENGEESLLGDKNEEKKAGNVAASNSRARKAGKIRTTTAPSNMGAKKTGKPSMQNKAVCGKQKNRKCGKDKRGNAADTTFNPR
jgi:hypothetical protein